MTDQVQEAQEQTETTDKEITLDEVYKEAGLDKVATPEPTPAVQPEPQPAKPEPLSVPDPYDTENFKAYMARKEAGTTALEQTVKQLVGFLTAKQQQDLASATRADIDKAVNAIDEVVQIGKPKVVEAYLDGMVREDSRMKAIWDNRAKNPTAWNNALKIAAKKMQDEFSIKTDPTLVAAQRARKEGQRQMASTATETNDDSWDGLSDEDFQRRWNSLLGGG